MHLCLLTNIKPSKIPGVKTYVEHIFIVNEKMIAGTGNVAQWLTCMNPRVQSSALGKVRVIERGKGSQNNRCVGGDFTHIFPSTVCSDQDIEMT